MPLTNAEKQRAWRGRRTDKFVQYEIALRWYADRDNYEDGVPGVTNRSRALPTWQHDNGDRARTALDAITR